MNILLTGASGFVGRALASALVARDSVALASAMRRHNPDIPGKAFVTGEMDHETDWGPALSCQDIVIHAAGRAHVMEEENADPLAEYRKVNVDGTLNLARQAVEAGVRRFIFISSIKVNGEQTRLGQPFSEESPPAPEDAYGISKLEAEEGLRVVAENSGMELVVIRPPLVYGPGVKGNFASMIKIVEKGLPLPLGAVYNKRSLVSLDNLVDLILTCLDHPAAANQVFLASDGEDLSTADLLRGVGRAMSRPARLFPVPERLLMLGASMLGKKSVAQRVLGSLQVDVSKARNLLGWKPVLSVEEGLRRCHVQEKKV